MSRSDIPRAIIVQDEGITGDSVIRVGAVADPTDTQQAGLSVQQPARDSTLIGDIRPTLTGTAERESAGDISVAMAGAEGNMRWGFVQDGASPSADFQFRQSPTVCGRRPDILNYSPQTTGEHYWAPTLVPLLSGDLLGLWMVQDVPFHSRDYATGWVTSFRRNLLEAETGRWGSSNANVPTLGDFGFTGANMGGGPYWMDMDVIQYPDTGELVCFLIGTAVSTNTVFDSSGNQIPGGGSLIMGACFSSTDEGLTWEQRSKVFFYAEAATIIFPSLYPGAPPWPTNYGQARCVSIETTRSGRLVAFIGAEYGAFSLTSDDRGRSWQGGSALTNLFTDAESADAPPEVGAPHASSSMRRMRDGVLICIHNVAARSTAGGNPPLMPHVWLTVDGITWTDIAQGMAPWPFTVAQPTYIDMAVVQRPDGYPAFYATIHADVFQGELTQLGHFDEFVTLPFTVRDVAPGDDANGAGYAVLPFGATGIHFHMLHDAGREGANAPNAPTGDLASYTDDPPVIDGFGAIGMATWRGQLVLIAAMMKDIVGTDAVFVHRLDHFQPMQERLEPNVSDIAYSAIAASDRWIAGYGRAWDAYDNPENWGYTLFQTGGTSSMQAPNLEGGYWESAVNVAQRYWEDSTLPWPDLNHNAVLRCVMQAVSGGDVDNPFMVVHLALFDTNQFVAVELRMEVVGADVVYQLHDWFGIVNIGAPFTLPFAATKFVEILIATWKLDSAANATNVAAYVRAYDPDTDPDLLGGYSLIASGVLTETSGPGAERVVFGHYDLDSVAEARWKTVQLWRADATGADAFLEYAPLAQAGISYVDDDGLNVRYDAALIINGPDVGFQNFMRAAQGIAYPAQFFADGLHAEWRGEAAVEGVIAYSTQYLYGARYLFDMSPPQREWRSRNTFENIEIVLDAEIEGGTGALFNPRAVAVVGRNWPICTFQFSNDDFVTIGQQFTAGIPGTGTIYERTTHLLAFTAGAGTTIGVGPYRVRVRTPRSNARGGQTFWPNRFRSQVGGAKFYIAITDTSTPHIFEIADNDKDTLYLKTNLVAAGITEIGEFCIFSDRFAWDFSYLMPDGDSGYRYLRLLLTPVIHGDEADSFFYRCGSVIFGQPVPFPAGIEWGYRVALAPGASTTFAITGAGYSTRNSAMRREWAVDAPVLRPPNEPETVDAMDIDQAVASWRKVSDMTRRVEANGEPCALIMDATRYEGDASEDGEQLLADPYDLAIVRASNVGNINHEAYMCREIPELNGTGNTEGVPKEVNVVAQVVFTEQL